MVRQTVMLSPPATFLGRLVWAAATIVVLVVAFFLLTAGLVLALALAAAAAARIWWNGRRMRQHTDRRPADLLEVEYTVEREGSSDRRDDPVLLPPSGRR